MILTADPNVLYAGNGYACYAGGDPVPMWRTMDGGASWQQVAAGINLKPLGRPSGQCQLALCRRV